MIHFEAGQHVRLSIFGHPQLSAQVLDVGERQIVLDLLLGGRPRPRPGEHAGAVLEYTAVRGLYRRLGTAHAGTDDRLVFVPDGEAELVQRRGFARVDVAVPVSVSVSERHPPSVIESVNLSGSGALLARPPLGGPSLDEGTGIWIEISISPDEEPIQARGTVLRTLEDGSKGIHFDFILDNHRDRLVHFLFERQRLMRQAGRD